VYISVTLLGLQRAQTHTDRVLVPLSKVTRVADVLAYLKEFYPELRISEDDVYVTVNDKISNMESILKNKDKVVFLPFLGGG